MGWNCGTSHLGGGGIFTVPGHQFLALPRRRPTAADDVTKASGDPRVSAATFGSLDGCRVVGSRDSKTADGNAAGRDLKGDLA